MTLLAGTETETGATNEAITKEHDHSFLVECTEAGTVTTLSVRLTAVGTSPKCILAIRETEGAEHTPKTGAPLAESAEFTPSIGANTVSISGGPVLTKGTIYAIDLLPVTGSTEYPAFATGGGLAVYANKTPSKVTKASSVTAWEKLAQFGPVAIWASGTASSETVPIAGKARLAASASGTTKSAVTVHGTASLAAAAKATSISQVAVHGSAHLTAAASARTATESGVAIQILMARLTPTVQMIDKITANFKATLKEKAVIPTVRAFVENFSAALYTAGVLPRNIEASLKAALRGVGVLSRSIETVLRASLHTVSTLPRTVQKFIALLTAEGKLPSNVKTKLNAALSTAGGLSITFSRELVATLRAAGAMPRNIEVPFKAALRGFGALRKNIHAALVATLSLHPIVALEKAIVQVLRAALGLRTQFQTSKVQQWRLIHYHSGIDQLVPTIPSNESEDAQTRWTLIESINELVLIEYPLPPKE